jgi:hypothetical protein
MKAVAAFGRVWILFTWSLVASVQAPMARPVIAWAEHWAENRSSILMLTAANTAITAASEAAARTVWPLITGEKEHGFLVGHETGETRVNSQSMISIIMTLFASLIGGPVYFLRKRGHRFLFFAGFGVVNSILSQSLVSFARDGMILLIVGRLWFDLVYNGSFKFVLFEMTRRHILKRRKCFISVASIRGTQDILTTCFRVAMLNLIGLKG